MLPEELRDWQPKKENKELFVTFEYMQYKVAKAWGRSPYEWRMLTKDDKATMMAFDKVENTIGAWYHEEADKTAKAKKKEIEKKNRNRPADKRR